MLKPIRIRFLTNITFSPGFLARYSPPQPENIHYQSDADGQLSLLDFEVESVDEPPDPDDFETLNAFREAIALWDAEHPEPLEVSLNSMSEWAPCPDDWYEPDILLELSEVLELSPAIESSITCKFLLPGKFLLPVFDAWCDRANCNDESPSAGVGARLSKLKPSSFPLMAIVVGNRVAERKNFSGFVGNRIAERKNFSGFVGNRVAERKNFSGFVGNRVAERKNFSGFVGNRIAERKNFSGFVGNRVAERKNFSGFVGNRVAERKNFSGFVGNCVAERKNFFRSAMRLPTKPEKFFRSATRLPTTIAINGKLEGLSLDKRAPTPALGDSSLQFARSHQASKTGIRNLQVMELSIAGESSNTSDSSSKMSGSYQSSGHGAHSDIEFRDTSSGSGCSASQSAIASRNALRVSKSSGLAVRLPIPPQNQAGSVARQRRIDSGCSQAGRGIASEKARRKGDVGQDRILIGFSIEEIFDR